jgi:hypothetical protein
VTGSVVADGELGGLAEMIAGLISGNLAAEPERERLLRRAHGEVNLRANDIGETVGITFEPGRVRVRRDPHPRPQVEIIASSDALMAFSTVPLRFGFPDAMTPDGRSLTRDLLKRKVIVRGLALHPGTVRRLQMLLTVT